MTDSSREKEIELIQGLKTGDNDSFQEAVRAYTLMENGALSDCLDRHLSALPETQRSALMLYEAHQHKSDDVCNILDVSASNLRVLLHRARQKIFLMVENFQETGEC